MYQCCYIRFECLVILYVILFILFVGGTSMGSLPYAHRDFAQSVKMARNGPALQRCLNF